MAGSVRAKFINYVLMIISTGMILKLPDVQQLHWLESLYVNPVINKNQ